MTSEELPDATPPSAKTVKDRVIDFLYFLGQPNGVITTSIVSFVFLFILPFLSFVVAITAIVNAKGVLYRRYGRHYDKKGKGAIIASLILAIVTTVISFIYIATHVPFIVGILMFAAAFGAIIFFMNLISVQGERDH